MYVVFIYGPAASGKYTIGSAVSEKLGVPLFHNHLTVDLASSLFEFGTEGFRTIRREIWQTSFRTSAAEDVSFIFTFHPEATVEPGLVNDLSETVADAGGSIFFVELLCSHEGVLERIGMDSRKQFGKLTDARLYEEIHAAGGFEYSGMPTPDLQIDTETVEPFDAAAMIVAALSAKLR